MRANQQRVHRCRSTSWLSTRCKGGLGSVGAGGLEGVAYPVQLSAVGER